MTGSADSQRPNETTEHPVACNNCRRRKLRCSRGAPPCSECVYESNKAKPGLKTGVIDKIHRRLDRLEDLVFQQEQRLEGSEPSRPPVSQQEVAGDEHFNVAATARSILSFLAQDLRRSDVSNNYAGYNESQEDGPHYRKRRRLDDGDEEKSTPTCPLDSVTTSARLVADSLRSDTLEDVLATYFDHIHPWIPIVHQARFRRRLLDRTQRSRLDVVLRVMVLVSSRFIENHESATDILAAGLTTAKARDQTISDSMNRLCVESLQALVICVFNDIGNGEAGKAWSLIGSLTRTAEYLQLTVEGQELLDRKPISKPFCSLPQHESWVEAEERRRVFWSIFSLDRFSSVTMGWNTSLTSEDVHRRLPCDGVYWRKETQVTTAFFGVWDKSAGRIGNPITFLPSHYASPAQVIAASADSALPSPDNRSAASIESPDEPRASSSLDALLAPVGAFAYCMEATESLSRVTSYFLQHKVNMRDGRDISSWLMRFKELDLRLVHWKMLLPRKWKAADPTTTTKNDTGRSNVTSGESALVMDPNLTLAHVAHNASMILLHQPIAFPHQEWEFTHCLPSGCSAETCLQAAVEIATITQNYLKVSSPSSPANPMFKFCVYIAARLLLVRWQYYSRGDSGTVYINPIDYRFGLLVQCLDEMSSRWAGPRTGHDDPGCEKMTGAKDNNLAAKYARKLREMHTLCMRDAAYQIDVMGYTQDIDHCWSSAFTSTDNPTDILSPRDEPQQDQLQIQMAAPLTADRAGALQGLGGNGNVGRVAVYDEQVYQPATTDRTPGDLGAISQVLLDQQFMEMDRIISFDDGMFNASLAASTWSD
ncbi:hypothetical protein FQN52_009194 [Onygenales sp. PD_12]|nr:hypothetical protein FQN52_009194 [Onygenales sp. PD_12]